MNHHTAVLFNGQALCLIFNGGEGVLLSASHVINGALSASQVFNGALSSSLLHHITTEKMNHHAQLCCLMGLCLLELVNGSCFNG